MPHLPNESIQFARLPDGIVIIRVQGKGTHMQSPSLRHVFEITRNGDPAPRYVIELGGCTTMDSTFLGTLASIGLHQRKQLGVPVIVTNIQSHVRSLLITLGLHHVLDLRPEISKRDDVALERFHDVNGPELSRLERLVMMIEAHQTLVDIDTQNEIKFEGVLKTLRDTLQREQNKDEL